MSSRYGKRAACALALTLLANSGCGDDQEQSEHVHDTTVADGGDGTNPGIDASTQQDASTAAPDSAVDKPDGRADESDAALESDAGETDASEPDAGPEPFGTLSITPLGRYWGGWYSKTTPASPPAYEPFSKHLFLGSDDRQRIEVIDLSDPEHPVRVNTFDLAQYGEPGGLVAYGGLVAVTVNNPIQASGFTSSILFFNGAGELVTEPVLVPGASRIRRTSDGSRLVFTVSGSASDDFVIDPEAYVGIVELGKDVDWAGCRQGASTCNLRPAVRIVSFTSWNSKKAELIAQGVRIIGPIEENLTVAKNLNPEGISISDDDRYAWITFERNNAIGRIDLDAGKLDRLFAVGSKDHSLPGNGFDASDRDGVNIKTWPVKSLYHPDGIEEFSVGGKSYLVTANEGDPYDKPPIFGEKVRVKDIALDPAVFPNAAELQGNNALGRLNVTNLLGDANHDGLYEELVMLGSRSFSIWTTEGSLVFDSGDDFEQITAEAYPNNFNSAEDTNDIDTRSDDRGPEPEHIEKATIGGRHFVFVNFERIGGFVTYEITNPLAPTFIQYVNTRNFAVKPNEVCGTRGAPALLTCEQASDLEPEGPLYIPREESPIDAALLVLIHEASDSVRIFRIDQVD